MAAPVLGRKDLYLRNPPFGGCLSTWPRNIIQGNLTVKGGHEVLLENKNAMIYGWGEFISGAVARTFANLTSGTFPSYITPALMATQRQRKAAPPDSKDK